MDKVMHFEIPAADMARAEGFYKQVFGWNTMSMPGMEYTMLHTGPTDDEGMVQDKAFINGGMFKRTEQLATPVITVVVEDIDAASTKITDHGGMVVRAKEKVGDMGYAAYFKDTEGNIMGLWQPIM